MIMQQTLSILGAVHQGFFMPKSASSIAPEVDGLMWYINIVGIFFAVLIFGITAYFAWRYRASKNPVSEPPGHNNVLEVVWSVIPAFLLLVMFGVGFKSYMEMSVPPQEGVTIRVTAKMWNWTFLYTHPDDGHTFDYDKLILPEGVPVQFVMDSKDVIHSLFIPTMRMKKDVVPGRFNKMWVLPTLANEVNPFKATNPQDEAAAWKKAYEVYCTEYCGTFHSEMLTKALVVKKEDYADALRNADDIYKGRSLAEVGALMYERAGCKTCHSIDGSKGTGPSWKDLYGKQGKFVDGTTYTADETYLHQSILEPQIHIVEGYGPAMPSYKGSLDDGRINAIIEYMKTISSHAPTGSTPLPESTKPASEGH